MSYPFPYLTLFIIKQKVRFLVQLFVCHLKYVSHEFLTCGLSAWLVAVDWPSMLAFLNFLMWVGSEMACLSFWKAAPKKRDLHEKQMRGKRFGLQGCAAECVVGTWILWSRSILTQLWHQLHSQETGYSSGCSSSSVSYHFIRIVFPNLFKTIKWLLLADIFYFQ